MMNLNFSIFMRMTYKHDASISQLILIIILEIRTYNDFNIAIVLIS